MPNSLWPHALHHTRLPCSSLSPRFVQTHVHWVGDAIQPTHPLSNSILMKVPAFVFLYITSDYKAWHVERPTYWVQSPDTKCSSLNAFGNSLCISLWAPLLMAIWPWVSHVIFLNIYLLAFWKMKLSISSLTVIKHFGKDEMSQIQSCFVWCMI